MQHTRKSGFTLVELMVVLGIAAIISSITFGAFKSVSEGNKRTTCQANLSQIYQACRLYAQDYDSKFPYLNPRKDASGSDTGYVARINTNTIGMADPTPAGGIGLWSLYTFRKTGDVNCDYPHNDVDLPLPESDPLASSLAGYIKNINIFHCPADSFERNIDFRENPTDTACKPQKVESGSFLFTTTAGQRRMNPAFLSYQTGDDVIDTSNTAAPMTPINTYSSFRLPGISPRDPADKDATRQLIYFVQDTLTQKTATPERPAGDNTIITWCRWHRNINGAMGETTTQLNRRNLDNVLFIDGTVQSLPVQQDLDTTTACNASTATGKCVTGWQRVPKRIQP